MPLLLCPNDNAAMQTVKRASVEFDMCPQCRGVWLDRGELEKLMEMSREEGEASPPQAPYGQAPAPQPYPQHAQPPQQPVGYQPRYHEGYGERGERGEYGERGDYGDRGHYAPAGQHGHRRKRGFDLFDIFD